MLDLKLIVLVVEDALASARFYKSLFNKSVIVEADTFTQIALHEEVQLGLWSRSTVEPETQTAGGATELNFQVANTQELNSLHEDWRARGVQIAQAPTRMVFGDTFTALDPDGHRIRIFAPS